MKTRLFIFGATGYTGRLVAEKVKELEIDAVLAGRNVTRLRALADRVGLPMRVAGLKQHDLLDKSLRDIKVVLNVAGSFSDTAETLVKACLRTGTHYLDVCGELATFRRLNNFARFNAGSMIMPGVGFTVLASDFFARYARERFEEVYGTQVHTLRVALSRVEFISRGSLRSMLDAAREGVVIRRDYEFEHAPVGQLERAFSFNGKDMRICSAVSLADVLTGSRPAPGYEKGIPNIETYVELTPIGRTIYQAAGAAALPLRLPPLRQITQFQIDSWPDGPTEAQRGSSGQSIVVEAADRYQKLYSCRFDTPNSYDFTAAVAANIAKFALAGLVEQGFHTPAEVYYDKVTAQILTPKLKKDAVFDKYKLAFKNVSLVDENYGVRIEKL